MFPVENESWSSKLTADDVESKEVVDNGSSYVITLYIKADEPSTDTAHGNGHNGKVFSVVMPSIVTDNAGGAAKIIKDVKQVTATVMLRLPLIRRRAMLLRLHTISYGLFLLPHCQRMFQFPSDLKRISQLLGN